MKSLANESSSDNALDGSDEKPDLACRNQFGFPPQINFLVGVSTHPFIPRRQLKCKSKLIYEAYS